VGEVSIGEVGGVAFVGELDDGSGEDRCEDGGRGSACGVSVEEDEAFSLSKEVDLLTAGLRAEEGCGGEAELVESEYLPGALDDDERIVSGYPVPAVEEAVFR